MSDNLNSIKELQDFLIKSIAWVSLLCLTPEKIVKLSGPTVLKYHRKIFEIKVSGTHCGNSEFIFQKVDPVALSFQIQKCF